MLTASLHTQPSNSVPESLNALDWLNFFLAALLTGFGPFVAGYLADLGWASADVGFVLTVAGLAGLLAQVPAGVFWRKAVSGAPVTIRTCHLCLRRVNARGDQSWNNHLINRKNGVLQAGNHTTACLLTQRYVALRNRAMALS